jgi:redox-sensing transcriptional repressor
VPRIQRNGNEPADGERRRISAAMDRASVASIARLSSYYRILEEAEREHPETISSKRLAERAGVTSAQVRKDLSFFGNFGRRGLGYNVSLLREEIGKILGLGRRWSVALIGAGNLGHALFAYKEFQKQGFHIEHVFDVDPAKVGQTWGSVRIRDVSELASVNGPIHIAILAVPVAAAQAVADLAVRAGIRAMLNFTVAQLAVPDAVTIRNVDLAISMESLSYSLVK